ncbi:MAG: hypothetical protein QG585_120 [Patescibacteria group bacterium]|jgi:hypothetical protein|nr:hypothetical protein [Patescibacteria group bacterium]
MPPLTKKELSILKKLNAPIKIQNFLDKMPINFEKDGETYMSPRRALRENKAHCFEGALIAALALWVNGEEPLLLDLKAVTSDVDHVVALYKKNGYWGAISKTNHATLRFRDPVYKSVRELAMSYFHEYFVNETGKKTLRSFAGPINLKKYAIDWATSEENLDTLVEKIDFQKHTPLFPKENLKYIRKADQMEIKAGKLIEWHKS